MITIDIEKHEPLPNHERITYLLGSSTDPSIVGQVKDLISPGETVMVVLDSDHSAPHVLAELRTYSGMVSPGHYIVVEDTNLNGHPVVGSFGPGPMEAVQEFLKSNDHYRPDKLRERLIFTMHPNGYLQRLK